MKLLLPDDHPGTIWKETGMIIIMIIIWKLFINLGSLIFYGSHGR
jgi:hypothetical protein